MFAHFTPHSFLAAIPTADNDDLRDMLTLYFQTEDNTSDNTRASRKRDIERFFDFLERDYGATKRTLWTARATDCFIKNMRATLKPDGSRLWAGRSIDRCLEMLAPFAKWVHKHRPFPAGYPPTKKVKKKDN